MLKAKHSTLIFLSGIVWLIGGCMLLPLGLNFIVDAILKENVNLSHPVLNFLAPYTEGIEAAGILWIALALSVGFLKARFIFSKSVQRSVLRILTLPNPVSIFKIYAPSYYVLLGSMVLLGYLVKFLPLDIRGGIDIIIGSALINGAVLYFRQAWSVSQQPTQ